MLTGLTDLRIESKRLMADCLLLVTAAFWGITFTIVKDAIQLVDVFVFLAQRFLLASLLLFPLCWKRRTQISKKTFKQGSLLGLFLFGAFAFQTVGLQFTSVTNTAFLTGLNVVLVPILGTLICGRNVSSQIRWSIALAIFGLYSLTTRGTWSMHDGDLLVIICAWCVAFQIHYTGEFALQNDVYWLTWIQLTTVTVLSGLAAEMRGLHFWLWEPRILWALVICAIFATVFAFIVQTSMQRFTSSTHTAIILCMEPVFGVLYACLAGGERLGPWAIVGASSILLAMIVAEIPMASGLPRQSQ